MVSNFKKPLIMPVKNFFAKIGKIFKYSSLADIYLYILIVLYPILPSYFVLFGSRVATVLAAGCILILFTTPQLFRLKLALPKIVIIGLVFLGYVSSSIANNEFFSTEFLSYLSNYFVIPLYCALLIDSKEKFDRMSSLMIVSGLVLCFFSIFEVLFKYNVFSLIETVDMGAIGSSSIDRFGIYRIESSFGQAIAFSIYLSYILCLVFYKLLKPENKNEKKQNLYLIIVLVLHIFIFLTSSRFPLIVTIFADILFFIKINKRAKIKILIAIGAILTCILVFTLIKGDSFFKKLFENIAGLFNGDTTMEEGNSLVYRLSLYENSAKVIGNDALFGRGLHVNTFFIMVSPYYGLFASTSFDNGFLYIYLMQGFFGVFSWLLFCFSVLSSCIFYYENGKNDFINFPIFLLVIVCLINMFSVARLDESRAFMVIVGCYLGLDFNPAVIKKNSKVEMYEIAV